MKLRDRLFRLFIFDWSGTISDDKRAVYESNLLIWNDFGIPTMSFDKFFSKVSGTLENFVAEQGKKVDTDELNLKYRGYFNQVVNNGIKPSIYPDARDCLSFLKEMEGKLAVLSSHPQNYLRREIEEYGLTDFFNSARGDIKNKTKGLQDMCENLGVSYLNTVYVGDTVFDVESAKRARICSVALYRGYHSRERLEKASPNLLAKDLDEFRGEFGFK